MFSFSRPGRTAPARPHAPLRASLRTRRGAIAAATALSVIGTPAAAVASSPSVAAHPQRNVRPILHEPVPTSAPERAKNVSAHSSTRARAAAHRHSSTRKHASHGRHSSTRKHASTRAHSARAHNFSGIAVPQWALQLAAKHRRAAGRPARIGTGARAARYQMPPRDVKRLLRVGWRAFGYDGRALHVRVARNYRQVTRESGRRPAVLQGYIGDVNDHHPAGGLLQFTTGTMRHWRVAHRADRFNPLDNILAAVNAQVHGPYFILNGKSGWSPPFSRNPLHRAHALRVVLPQPTPAQRGPIATPASTRTSKPAAGKGRSSRTA